MCRGILLYGIEWVFGSPISQAWTIDLADDNNRGRLLPLMWPFHSKSNWFGISINRMDLNDVNRLPYAFLLAAAFCRRSVDLFNRST
jgi:hypothetical protein